MKELSKNLLWSMATCAVLLLSSGTAIGQSGDGHVSQDTVFADIVAIDQPVVYNRLGAHMPNGLMYALRSDVEKVDTHHVNIAGTLKLCKDIPGDVAGCMRLRADKRPRPIVIRANIGDIIKVQLTNFITPSNRTGTLPEVGFTVNGMQFVKGIQDDGSWVGSNADHQVKPNAVRTYYLYAEEEGAFVVRDAASNKGFGDTSFQGLFGSVSIHPKKAEWYRSQVTQLELFEATNYYLAEDGSRRDRPATLPAQFTPPGHPILDYSKLRMYEQVRPHFRKLISTDLTAVITGEGLTDFVDDGSPIFASVPASPNRTEPYREISIHYHNNFAGNLQQAFADSLYKNENLFHGKGGDLLTGNDIFSFNYGSAGITSEIYANRVGVGPMKDCIECEYEEFFLSSWAVGDPAMHVDVNATTSQKEKTQATKAYYPDDPSNVYHSYMQDHVKFRINHNSPNVTHVHHQHAHQWLHSPNSDDGHYLDSQTINPGASWTLEMVYNGSGNRNQTVGDNIFHCHFYPHFASGMWALWRVHDVLETGTQMNEDGTVATHARALPDGEIETGTPIPAIVPLPTKAMAPLPGEVYIEDGQMVMDTSQNQVNPGFPFFIPGIAGSRAPHPPLDFAVDPATGKYMDGGLPRHIIRDGKVPIHIETLYDWTKISTNLDVVQLPEEGTPIEKIAMDAHATRKHPTFTPDGTRDNFILNGLPPAPGAPFAAPYVDDDGNKVGTKRTYKAANIQMDVVFNKQGWHYPQQRLLTLWQDVQPTLQGIRPPEPLFFRANTDEYIEYWHTNLMPGYYESDDFQVRTPTDVIGQHIHLVKFDVTSSDGAVNGWNYEDGSFSPDEVRHRINAIKYGGKIKTYLYEPHFPLKHNEGTYFDSGSLNPITPDTNVFGTAPSGQDWAGAQTTIQLWYADSLMNNEGSDRTLRTVFTHDHFGPSTHQQIGLYAGLLVEPEGSKWYDPIKENVQFGKDNNNNDLKKGRIDGGPTSFQANIVTADEDESYREFALEFQELQLSYTAGSKPLDPYPEFPIEDPTTAKITAFKAKAKKYTGYRDPAHAIDPPSTPQIISVGSNIGTYTINYRNEPLLLRLMDPSNKTGKNTFGAAEGLKGDLSFGFSSQIERKNPNFNQQPKGVETLAVLGGGTIDVKFPDNALTPGMQTNDPYTPLLRAYENDRIQVRALVGAHEVPHIFGMHTMPWLFEPSNTNSGYRSTQMMSISEHFEMLFQLPKGTGKEQGGTTDYLYNASQDNQGTTQGIWGMLRTYNGVQKGLVALPNNQPREAGILKTCGCPQNSTKTDTMKVSAIMVSQLSNIIDLNYNTRDTIIDHHAMVFVEDKYLATDAQKGDNYWTYTKAGAEEGHLEPLVLRARSGDCVRVQLTNRIDTTQNSFKTERTTLNNKSTGNLFLDVNVSSTVGMHPQLLSYNTNNSDGAAVGLNDDKQVAAPGETVNYRWYAGRWEDGKPTDIEFGTVLLSSSDPMEQYAKGLFGALIIEPKGASWKTDENTETSATVTYGGKSFREMVIFSQDNLLLEKADGKNANVGYGVNYKSEPTSFRGSTGADATANQLVKADPQTPIFVAAKSDPVRIRLLKPGGAGNPETFVLDGHGFYEEPYQNNSTTLGKNKYSQWLGSRPQVSANNNFDLLIDKAGGEYEVAGDYLYRIFQGSPFNGGMWGLVRITEGNDAPTLVNLIKETDGTYTLSGTSTVNPNNGKYPTSVSLTGMGLNQTRNSIGTYWTFTGLTADMVKHNITVSTNQGGSRAYTPQQLEQLNPTTNIPTVEEEDARPAAEANVRRLFFKGTRQRANTDDK